jgi:hypothetical protein
MGRGRISVLISGAVLALLVFGMAGRQAFPQSYLSAMDSQSRIRENVQTAVITMRMLSGTEIEFRENSDKHEFGTVIDLFGRDLIDADLADALGCPQMTSAKGNRCGGKHAPFHGYLYRLEIGGSASAGAAKFRIVGSPAVAKGLKKTGTCTFFVDQTQVIRASDDTTVEAGPKSPALGTPEAPVIR